MYNKIIIIGHVGSEIKTILSKDTVTSITKFSVATNYKQKKPPFEEWLNSAS